MSTPTTTAAQPKYRRSAVKMIDPALEAKKERWERQTDQYFVDFEEQQLAPLKAYGHDTDGLVEWCQAWLIAWNEADLQTLELCVAPDCTWDDPSLGGELATGREELSAWFAQFLAAWPDLQFFPWDGECLFAYRDGNPYCVIPWQAIGTWTRPWRLWHNRPGGPTIAAPGTTIDFTGVDRYFFRRSPEGPGGWQIVYAKSNYDVLTALVSAGMLPPLTSRKALPLHLALGAAAAATRARQRLGLLR